MKSKFISSLFISGCCLFLLLAVACERKGIPGNGVIKEESRDIEDFTGLSVSGSFQVDLDLEEEAGFIITGEENLLPFIRSKNQGGRLIIDTNQKISPTETIKIKLSAMQLEELESSGANNIVVEKIKGSNLEVDLSGAGSINLTGEVDEFELDVQGVGNVYARSLIAKQVDISLVGAANAEAYAAESLDARVTGVGSIDYYGNPQKVDSNVTGVGRINRKE